MGNNFSEKVIQKWQHIDQAEKSAIAASPALLMLEVTNACNLKCVMCNNTNMKRKRSFMPLETGKKLIRDAAKMGIKEVALYTVGEPLLYSRLDGLIREAKVYNLYCYLTSNGLLLNKEMAEMFCRQGLDSFKFSIDTSDKKEYESMRIGGSFDKLIANVIMLKETRDALKSGLKIICGAIAMSNDEKKIKAFKDLFGGICDSVFISDMSNLGGKIERAGMPNGAANNKNKPPCRLLWDRIVVCHDGKLTACCVDFDAELVYADYDDSTLEKAWNNETIQRWREAHLCGKTHLIPMCGQCNSPFLMQAGRIMELNK